MRPQLRYWSQGIWKHTTCATRVFFLPLFTGNFRRPIESTFSQVCYFMRICWHTPSENTGLWQLPKVSSAFKVSFQWFFWIYNQIKWFDCNFSIALLATEATNYTVFGNVIVLLPCVSVCRATSAFKSLKT